MRETAGIAAAPAARCNKVLRGSFILNPPSRVTSLDHLVGAGEHGRRYVQTERFSRLEVDDSLVLGRRLYREVGRLLASKDAMNVGRRLPIFVDDIRSIGG